MHWSEVLESRNHSRVLYYLMEPEHDEFGPPSLEMVAAALGTDSDSAWNLLKPLVDGGMVVMEAAPYGGPMFSVGEVLGEVG